MLVVWRHESDELAALFYDDDTTVLVVSSLEVGFVNTSNCSLKKSENLWCIAVTGM